MVKSIHSESKIYIFLFFMRVKKSKTFLQNKLKLCHLSLIL